MCKFCHDDNFWDLWYDDEEDDPLWPDEPLSLVGDDAPLDDLVGRDEFESFDSEATTLEQILEELKTKGIKSRSSKNIAVPIPKGIVGRITSFFGRSKS